MGDFIEFLYARFLLSDGVSIDTRTIKEGNLFFAIDGPNFSANQFATEALQKGASYAVVDDEKYVTDERILLTDDSLQTLQELSKFHRGRFKRPVLGITGSNGKTTTKDLIAKVLSRKYIVHATSGNYNNHIGVPLTLLHLHPQVEVAVIEMGANHIGEITELCTYATPTHGLITNIGHAHTEGFGGFEGVIRGKCELFDYLKVNGGLPFINMDDAVLSNMSKQFEDMVIYPGKDMKVVRANPTLEIEVNRSRFKTNLVGKYNFENIAVAIEVGRFFGVSDEKICKAVSDYVPGNARSQIIHKGHSTIILDAYNANPDSMKAALENLSEMKGRKVAILGDMNELDNSDEAHMEVLQKASTCKIDQVITIGAKMGRANGADIHFGTKDELIFYLEGQKFSDSVVLLKASRSIELESIAEKIKP